MAGSTTLLVRLWVRVQNGHTALLCAARYNDLDCVRVLVEGGANMNVKDTVCALPEHDLTKAAL